MKNEQKGVDKTMGLFSNKKEQIKSSGMNIPLPPASNRGDNFGNSNNSNSRFKDDFEHPFDVNQPISAQIRDNPNQNNMGDTTTLMPTTLGPTTNLDLGLPSFTTQSNHNLDLDAIEKELAIPPEKKEKNIQNTSADNKENNVLKNEQNLIPEEQNIKSGFDEIKMPIEKEEKDEFNLDEIPDEIEDIPDFIPELDVEEQMFSENTNFIEEPKEKKSAYIGINSILNVKKNSGEIKLMLNNIAEGTISLEDNDRKQKELLSKSKTLFEDVERKILFINKILFSEE